MYAVCVVITTSPMDTSHTGLSLPHMASCYLNYLLENSTSKYSHIGRYYGLGLFHCMHLGDYNAAYNAAFISPEVEQLDCMVNVCLTSYETTKLDSIYHVAFPSAAFGIPVAKHSRQQLVLARFPILTIPIGVQCSLIVASTCIFHIPNNVEHFFTHLSFVYLPW